MNLTNLEMVSRSQVVSETTETTGPVGLSLSLNRLRRDQTETGPVWRDWQSVVETACKAFEGHQVAEPEGVDGWPFPRTFAGRRLIGWAKSGNPLYVAVDESGHATERTAVTVPRKVFLRSAGRQES